MVATLVRKQSTGESRSVLPDLTKAEPFDFIEYFHGHTRASGWFSDRFGKPRRHFCGDFFGYFENGKFFLDENLFYTDGVVEERIWQVNIDQNGIFKAESESLIGGANGAIEGNTLKMSYTMSVKIEEGKFWDLDMKDLMILQPDNSLHNITQVRKWGVRIGTVSAQYIRHDGDMCCIPESGNRNKARVRDSVGSRRAPARQY